MADVSRTLGFRGKLLDLDVAELDEGGLAHPLAVLPLPMVLESDGPPGLDPRQERLLDDRLPVQDHGEAVAHHRDLEAIPLADVLVRELLRCNARTDGDRHLVVRAIPVDFPGAHGPAPDV